MNQIDSLRVVISAGGTGGHVFPGIAVAEALKNKGCQVSWIGRADSKESEWVTKAGIAFEAIEAEPLRGKGALAWIRMPYVLAKSVLLARKVLKRTAPDVALTLGGYVSAPVGLASRLLRIPLIVHEQNAVMGMTNKLLSTISQQVLCGFPNATNRQHIVVGNPIRASLKPKSRDAFVKESYLVAVFGGSQGAKFLNDNIPTVLSAVAKKVELSVLHQTGKPMQKEVEAAYEKAGNSIKKINVSAFVSDMGAALGEADLLIARAGAMTVSEVALIGIPTIFVPFPHAVDDHQTKNAECLVAAKGALLMQQSEFDEEKLVESIVGLLEDADRRADMSTALKNAFPSNSAELVAQHCIEAAMNKKGRS